MKNTHYTETLNKLLASYQIHYQNLRSLHWNIKGQRFFELHLKYEELYNRSQIIVDEVAERILSIGGTPLYRFNQYLATSVLKENDLITDGSAGMSYIHSAQNELLALEREILQLSENENDEGTNSLMSDLIREKEKTNWMFAAWLNQD